MPKIVENEMTAKIDKWARSPAIRFFITLGLGRTCILFDMFLVEWCVPREYRAFK